MEDFTPKVTIELYEYNRLKDLEYQFKYLIDRVKVDCFREVNPATTIFKEEKIGYINKKDLDFFYKNLLDIDKLVIDGGKNGTN